jgi:putative restriction endonuclease
MSNSVLRLLLEHLPDRHRRALEWFDDHAGQEVPWPGQLADGTLLASKAKGIYKPEWSRCALSVRRSLQGPYPDREVRLNPDGSWVFEYFQEGIEPSERDRAYTNAGLMECMKEVVPVGVFIQTRLKPGSRYRILGLALVAEYDAGYFRLDGNVQATITSQRMSSEQPRDRADAVADVFRLSGIEDERIRTFQLINQRRGQQGFRRSLLDAYGRRCSVTGYEAVETLEAAHIVPYRGPVTNHPSNGILLRADMHTLFDLNLIAVDYDSRTLLLRDELKGTKYQALLHAPVAFPSDERLFPSRGAVAWHRERSRL